MGYNQYLKKKKRIYLKKSIRVCHFVKLCFTYVGLGIRTGGHSVKLFEAVGHGHKFESQAAILEGKNDSLLSWGSSPCHAQSSYSVTN